eukprot:5513520-Amphidinium_carterae.1
MHTMGMLITVLTIRVVNIVAELATRVASVTATMVKRISPNSPYHFDKFRCRWGTHVLPLNETTECLKRGFHTVVIMTESSLFPRTTTHWGSRQQRIPIK